MQPSKKPNNTAFTQQTMSASSYILSPSLMVGLFGAVGVVLLALGGWHLSTSAGVVELTKQYDNIVGCPQNGQCSFDMKVEAYMKAPVYLYYRLSGFFSNHRLYVKSRNDLQLAGTLGGASPSTFDPSIKMLNNQVQESGLQTSADMLTSSCFPRAFTYDDSQAPNGTIPVLRQAIYPCGFIAASRFTDHFDMCVKTNGAGTCDNVTLHKNGIAWPTDVSGKFVNISSSVVWKNGGPSNFYDYGGIYDRTLKDPSKFMFDRTTGIVDEDLVSWMRTSSMSTFKKLHRIIKRDLNAGDVISVTASTSFDLSSIGGTKSLVLSTMSWLGGKHTFLGAIYMIIGGICVLEALVFFVLNKAHPRLLGDLSIHGLEADE